MHDTVGIINRFNKELFNNNLKQSNFLKRSETKKKENYLFSCCYKDDCDVKEKKHPIWTPAFGEEKTPVVVMVIGEAPSTTEGAGVHIGGLFGQWKNETRSPVVHLRDWVKENFGTIPYYTDLVKCGVARQQNKEDLKKRIPKCIIHLLKYEIDLLQPTTILCLGNTAYDVVSNLENVKDKDIDVFKLMHYSSRASLPLTIENKKKIIWKWQVGKLSREELEQIPLSEISPNFWEKSKPTENKQPSVPKCQ